MQKYKKPFDQPHVRVYFSWMDSKAWKNLPAVSIVVLLELIRKRRAENRFSLSYSLLRKATGYHNKTTARALRELEKVGFIDIKEKGGLFRRSNVYAVSDRWKQYEPTIKPKKKRKSPWLANYKSRQKVTRTDPSREAPATSERDAVASNNDVEQR